MGSRISRRQALKYGLGAGAALALPAMLSACSDNGSKPSAGGNGGGSAAKDLPYPRVLTSHDGVLALTLTATPAVVDIGAAQPASTWTYDLVVPGHTWEIRGGDTLKVDLVNSLPPLPDGHPVDLTRPHEWTTTNLHTHGLHVSPAPGADNVFLELPPGERTHIEIPVPADHPGGIFWYHPHKHGGVCQQIRGGMAGMLIVRGEIDDVPEVKAAKEQVMVLQSIELGPDYQLMDPIPHPTKTESFFPRTQVFYTVNGVLTPKIRMYPGEVQRWRLLNAAEGKFMALQLTDHDFHVLAWDGLTLAEPDTVDDVRLGAGNRVEVLVQAGAAGTYDLMLTPGSSQHPDIPGGLHVGDSATSTTGFSQPSAELTPRTMATVEVAGSGPPMRLPTTLPAFDPPILPIARARQFSYTVEREPNGEFVNFGVDGLPFDPARAPYQMKLGTAEEWTLTNAADHSHVFHVHVNPFKVVKLNGQPLAKPFWRDTLIIDTPGDSATFQSNFVDFTGKTVDHCHIVSHEDLGMMEAVEIVN